MNRALLASICLASMALGLVGCNAPDIPEDPDSATSYALWKLPRNEPIPAPVPVGRRPRVAIYDEWTWTYPRKGLLVRVLKENRAIEVGPTVEVDPSVPPGVSPQNDPDDGVGAYFLSQLCDRAKQLNCDFVIFYGHHGSAGLALSTRAAAQEDAMKEELVLVDASTHRPVASCSQLLTTFVVFPKTASSAGADETFDENELRTLRLLAWQVTRPLAVAPSPATTVPATRQ